MKEQIEAAYRKERKGLLNFVRARVNSLDEAEDIVQEVFVNALSRLDVTVPIMNLAAWFYKAAYNKVIDWYRKKKNTTVSLYQESKGVTMENLLTDSGINLEQDMMRKAAVEMLLDFIDQLPAKQKEVIILQAIEGKSFREISEKTGTPINTLLARKHNAVRSLKKRLAALKKLIEEQD